MPDGSAPAQLSKTDWRKIGKGAAIALGGSALAYLATEHVAILEGVKMGWAAPIAAVLINMGLKWCQDTRGRE